MDSKKVITQLMPELTRLTAKYLELEQEKLKQISWHDGESNTDTEFSNFAKECCIKAYQEIDCDFELAVETPDLLLLFTHNGEVVIDKIELKSTKSKGRTTLGSMIMSLDLNQWTIFCCRGDAKNEIRYGRYHLGMKFSSHEKFQDRSPRPQLHFDQFQGTDEEPRVHKVPSDATFWRKYAKTAINRIVDPKSHSWQDDLITEVVREVLRQPDKFKKLLDDDNSNTYSE